MIEKILQNIYKIRIPLPGNPLKEVNCYLIKAPNVNLIVDTGMNHKECLDSMLYALDQLSVNLKETNFFITHFHVDHFGLITKLATDTSKVYMNHDDAIFLSSPNHWDEAMVFAKQNGFPEEFIQQAILEHPGYKYSPSHYPEFCNLVEGEKLKIGDYEFTCIATPGHSKGSMCLYEQNKKFFVSGDHLLDDVTPNISIWKDTEENPLEDYLQSLQKVFELDIDLVLPGHRHVFQNHRKRINELKMHHEKRLQEIMSIINVDKKSAYEIASEMKWALSYNCWDHFPIPQKWFATGEAFAHIKYLEMNNKVVRDTLNRFIIKTEL